MTKTSTAQAFLVALLFLAIALSPSTTQSHIANQTPAVTIEATPEPPSVQNSTFYTVRADMRKCASPMCGGYFVKRVNQSVTKCANGRNMPECYVADIDWNGASEVEASKALIRGTIHTKGDRHGKYGVLKVLEAWQAVSDGSSNGEFYRVRDLGVRCIAAPCETHHEAKLNTTISRNVAGVNLPSNGTSESIYKSLTSEDGVLVIGSLADVTGPAGRSKTLNATRVYLPTNATAALKPCIKTGCSKQICADEEMMSTCDYRPEFECYKKAACERQADGNCGFTKTTELNSCLIRSKRSGV
jgi:hypothetical protein